MSEKHNIFCWVDIPVTNLDRAMGFYAKILAAPVNKINEHGMEFALLPHEEDNVSGCLSVMDGRVPSKNGPLVYLNVDGRLDEALKAVKPSGGTIIKEREVIGPYGVRAIITDTEGNVIALYSKS